MTLKTIPLVVATETSAGKIRIEGGLAGYNGLRETTRDNEYKPLAIKTETVRDGKHLVETNVGGIKTVEEVPGLPVA